MGYSGVFYTVAVAAPAVGYVLSGAFLRIPIDFKLAYIYLSLSI